MLRNLISGMLGKSANESDNKPNELPMSAVRPTRQTIMHMAFEFAAKSDLDGCFAEFGCYQGASCIRAFQAYEYWLEQSSRKGWNLTRQPMFIFDSFAGLPELSGDDQLDEYAVFKGGQYACSEPDVRKGLQEAGVDLSLIKTIEGFYEDSLTAELKEEINFTPPLVVHIDCDLRSSAETVLHWLTESIQDGVLLLFDDYFCYRGNPRYGVRRAFEDWLKETRFISTHYLNYSWAGSAFIINKRDV